MSFLSRSRREDIHRACCLCARSVDDVPHLVAGVRGAVCSLCIEDTIAILPGYVAASCARAAVHAALKTLPATTPLGTAKASAGAMADNKNRREKRWVITGLQSRRNGARLTGGFRRGTTGSLAGSAPL